MDQFFQEGFQFDLCWYDTDLPMNQSAFLPYISRPQGGIPAEISGSGSNNSSNVNKRMIEFLRRSWQVRIGTEESQSNRFYNHMMCERSRRMRERNGYLDLHSMLPPGTKKDKNSIIQMAARQIQELERSKEVLERRNHELEGNLPSMENGNVESRKIRLKVANPSSGLDSMLEVLKCLKRRGLETVSIQSKLSDQELVAVIGIDKQIEDAEMEKDIYRTLQEVERQRHSQSPEGYWWFSEYKRQE